MLMVDSTVHIDEIDVSPVQIQGPKSKALMKDLMRRSSRLSTICRSMV